MPILHPDALNERANNLGAFNGLKLALVTVPPGSNPPAAQVQVFFHNSNELQNILNAIAANPDRASQIFPISGGHRLPAGSANGQVQVTGVTGNPARKFLNLTVSPVGDYSTYRLEVLFNNMDPVFGEIAFKFRPGCFSTNCAPEWVPASAPPSEPAIHYLAKDFESFKHTLITAMMERVPGWQATSEADLDQVLIELFSAAADELSDYQDRVMNEAYLASARKRVSLARLARLMDYHIHQGNQASTWLAMELMKNQVVDLPKPNPVLGGRPIYLTVWAGADKIDDPHAVVFMARPKGVSAMGDTAHLDYRLNRMSLYTWDNTKPSLAAGDTTADLLLKDGPNDITDKVSATIVQDLIRSGQVSHLIIQEHLNPSTGSEPGRNPRKRQLLKLISGQEGAAAMFDPLTATVPGDPMTAKWFVRVRWEQRDQLQFNYCFTVDCPAGKVEDVSLFHGNLIEVFEGRPQEEKFFEPGTMLTQPEEFHYERTEAASTDGVDRWGTICRLRQGPLAYQAPADGAQPTGDLPPVSTLEVEVEMPGGGKDQWDEQISLVHSDDSDENGDHFVVETDEQRNSLLRFGNGTNGKKLPANAVVHCFYQVGGDTRGNVGADQLIWFDQAQFPEIVSCWNPFDVVDGRDPESREKIVRNAPEAYRARQLRAVTLLDYVRRAEALPGVSKAAARYAWTGSWRTVRITIDPVGKVTEAQRDQLHREVAQKVDAVRLVGEDLEIRPPRYVPLEVRVALCVHSHYWPQDLRFVLEQEFSDGFTPDGRKGFFHPDLWTFAQALHVSQISGRLETIEGVEHVISIRMRRFNEKTPGTAAVLEMGPSEIIQVKNDPDHMEEGFIEFDLRGGRQ